MRYVVGLMMARFFLGGLGMLIAGVRGLLLRLAARGRLLTVEGKIIHIEIRQQSTDSESSRTTDYYHPEIRFRSEELGETTFLSEHGIPASRSPYAEGQKIAVLDDPAGKIQPMIHSWAAMWMTHLLYSLFGPIFIGAALLIYWAFGDKPMGRG